MSRFTLSMMSIKASFLRYLMSCLRQAVAPVACMVTLLEAASFAAAAFSDLTPSVVMYNLRVSLSLFCGYPKSRISSRSS